MDLDLVIATHRRPLERHLRRRVGDPSLAEELAQETFLRAWQHAPDGLPELRLRAWLYRVATNLAIDALRARAGRPLLDGGLLDQLERATAPQDEDRDERLAIEAALAQLPARERALVTLQLAGYGPTDAARLLHTTPEAARKRLTRARERFRRAYAEAEADGPGSKPLVLLLVRDEQPELYERWLAGAEVRVRRVSHAAAARQLATAHALVLTGDDHDLHPALYGQELRGARDPRLAEDRADAAVLHEALASGLPVLGICRGHQLLNVAYGGTLHQDLGAEQATARPELHADRRMHAVATGEGSHTRRIVGRHAPVPSLHHQAVDRLGRGLRVAARSADGIVEGIEDPRRPFAVGIQWHAELPEAGIAGRRVRDALADAALRHASAQPVAVAA